MPHAQSFWLFLAGIALFIMGMRSLEEALRNLAGRTFKLWLRHNAGHPLRALFSGTVVTMLMQSSSIVNLLVLAFVGAGIIGMQQGMALVMGANLGTTATSWLIALLGFEWKVEALAMPLMGVAGIFYYSVKRDSRLAHWLLVLLGFGMLFTGLGFIKSGAEVMVADFPLQQYSGYHPVVFLLIGFVVSSLVQSSGATMAITLSILASGGIALTDAMAVALGAEVGTTLKVVLAAIGGSAEKKRVALGNLLFNLVGTLLFLFMLDAVAKWITEGWGLHQPTLALVAFQTLVNVAGVLVFLPMLKPLGRWLNRRFTSVERKSLFLAHVPVVDADLAMEQLRNEVVSIMHHVLLFSKHLFGEQSSDAHEAYYRKDFSEQPLLQQYQYIKVQHGEILDYYARMQQGQMLKPAEALRAERLASAARNTIYAAKSFKDAMSDVQEFAESGKDFKYEVYRSAHRQIKLFAEKMDAMLFEQGNNKAATLVEMYQQVQQNYQANIGFMYSGVLGHQLTEIDLSSILNLNRELTTGMKSLTIAAFDLLLNEEERKVLEELPGFIR